MKKAFIVTVVLLGLSVGTQVFGAIPFPYQTTVDGRQTLLAEGGIVVGGQFYPVSANPQTIEEIKAKIVQLEAQKFELLRTSQALQASDCKE